MTTTYETSEYDISAVSGFERRISPELARVAGKVAYTSWMMHLELGPRSWEFLSDNHQTEYGGPETFNAARREIVDMVGSSGVLDSATMKWVVGYFTRIEESAENIA